MKKSVAWIACLCMLAALLPAGALAADVAGGDYDFESDYTWITGYNFPYANSGFTNLFQADFEKSQSTEAAAQVKPVDGGRALSLLTDTRAVIKGGSVTNAMKFQFRIRKDDIASGNLSVVFRTPTYAQGNGYGHSDLTLCTFTSGGKITTLDSTVVDSERWKSNALHSAAEFILTVPGLTMGSSYTLFPSLTESCQCLRSLLTATSTSYQRCAW